MRSKTAWAALATLLIVLTACAAPQGNLYQAITGQYQSNGARIYFTGTSDNDIIRYSGGIGGMMGGQGMMGMRFSCADCHGADGRGGTRLIAMTTIDVPDIRWSTLTQTGQEAGATAEPGHAGEMEHEPYDEQSFKKAITQGIEPDGDTLDPTMPRWEMSDQDVQDLIAFLKTLH